MRSLVGSRRLCPRPSLTGSSQQSSNLGCAGTSETYSMPRKEFTVQGSLLGSLLTLGKRLYLRPPPAFSPLTFPEAVFLTLSLVLIIYPLNFSSVRTVFGWETPAPDLIYLAQRLGASYLTSPLPPL